MRLEGVFLEIRRVLRGFEGVLGGVKEGLDVVVVFRVLGRRILPGK